MKLSLSAIRTLIAAGTTGPHGLGDNLWLVVRAPGRGSVNLRFTSPITRKAREMGLGPVGGSVTLDELAALVNHAEAARALIAAGRDPLDERHPKPVAEPATPPGETKFRVAASKFIASRQAGWRNAKHAAQWTATLETYAFPHIGDTPVGEIGIDDVLAVLEPIWTAKTETASRVRGRCEAITDYAHARGWCGDANPWRWRGRLQMILPPRGKVAPVEHHAAEPWEAVPALMVKIMAASGIAARALAFTILTAARSGEVRGAKWPEIDLERRLWTIPAGRMKARREHVVPLSDAAIGLLREMRELRVSRDGLVFPSPNGGESPLSDMSLSAVLRRLGRGDITVHGFRSSFRDWCGEATDFPRELAESALAHAVGDKTEAAYRRGTAIARRVPLMRDWAAYLLPPPAHGSKVVQFKRK